MPELQKGSKSLANHFEALFNYATMGILIADSHGRILDINPFALYEFGYQEGELVGQPVEVLIPGRYASHIQHREGYLEKPVNRHMGVGKDLFGIRKDGGEFPVEVSLGTYQTNGELFVVAFISNVSVRKQADLEIKKLNDELESTVALRTSELTKAMEELQHSKEEISRALEKEMELSELKSRFVSMASHEFRTPLSTVLSSAFLIQKYPSSEDQPKRERHLQRIISSVNLLTDILNDFLSLGKIEEGKIQIKPTPFNIKEKIESVITEVRSNLKPGQVIHYFHVGPTDVFLDFWLLKHILINLLSNACKFSDEGQPIEISSTQDKNMLTITVKDCGIGISPQDQKHLSEKFFRGGNANNIQGTGLGLHIVSHYINLMNGEVKWISELKKGTEFILSFKMRRDHEKSTDHRG
jgi:PAS domain S-box-containing protein